MKKKRRPIPAFKSEAQEQAFWESHGFILRACKTS